MKIPFHLHIKELCLQTMSLYLQKSYREHPHWSESLFLQSGFLLQWDSQWNLIAWGRSHKESKPQEKKISCYIPDFYMEDEKPWCIFEYGGLFPRSPIQETQAKKPQLAIKQTSPRLWQDPQIKRFLPNL